MKDLKETSKRINSLGVNQYDFFKIIIYQYIFKYKYYLKNSFTLSHFYNSVMEYS